MGMLSLERCNSFDPVVYSIPPILSSCKQKMGPAPRPARKLLDQVHETLRLGHYSRSTEKTYVFWIRRYILFHHKRHPLEMGEREIEEFL